LRGIRAVYYREITNFGKRWLKVFSASVVYPALFLLAFGYGIGMNAQVNGVCYIKFLIPGLLTMSSMNQAYGISLEVHISRYYYRLFEEYLLAPIGRWEIVVGEVLYGITKGIIPAAILL
jgi:ABC-2 type transport system permease protein